MSLLSPFRRHVFSARNCYSRRALRVRVGSADEGRARRRVYWFLVLASLALVSSCREGFRSLGPDGPTVQTNADQLFGALVARYSQVVRDHTYELARDRLTRTALVPSKIFDDTTVWTSRPSPVLRLLVVQGSVDDGRYVLVARPRAPRPLRPGDSRHVITLARLSHNEFAWDTSVDFSIGAFPAAAAGDLASSLLGSAEGRAEPQIRADYRAVVPRAAIVLSSLFSIDSIRTTAFSDGTTDVALTVGIHPDRLKTRYPAFGDYLAKYVNPARYRMSLTDGSGAMWFDVQGAESRLRLHYRTMRGRLVPLYGPPRIRPDTLELRVDFTTRFKFFRVGMRDLVSEFVITATPVEQAWTIIYRHEPHWDLPLISEKLLRTPLRRPFEGEGVIFHIGVRDSAGAPTLVERRSHVVVQESAILRFLNALGSSALSDLADRTEREEEQFLREIFVALHADARALVSALGAVTEEKTNAADP